jgi:hypothetical protein
VTTSHVAFSEKRIFVQCAEIISNQIKMKLEDERGSMDRKLEELERRDAISKAAVQVAVAPTSAMVRDRVQNVHTTHQQSPITNHPSPITNHQSPITNHQSPITEQYTMIAMMNFMYTYTENHQRGRYTMTAEGH